MGVGVKCDGVGVMVFHSSRRYRQPTDLSVGGNHKKEPMTLVVGNAMTDVVGKRVAMIAVIDYNAGNVQSVLFALERLGAPAILTDDHAKIRAAEKVIFPGVGEASTTMHFLRERGLDEVIKSLTQPTLGICVGMQLLCAHSEENDTPCLGVIPQRVKRFIPVNGEKVPHMGWNSLSRCADEIFIPELSGEYVYYVHSYYVEQGPYTSALSEYTLPFSAGLHKDNFYATQFHVEKSGKVGEAILRNFLKL